MLSPPWAPPACVSMGLLGGLHAEPSRLCPLCLGPLCVSFSLHAPVTGNSLLPKADSCLPAPDPGFPPGTPRCPLPVRWGLPRGGTLRGWAEPTCSQLHTFLLGPLPAFRLGRTPQRGPGRTPGLGWGRSPSSWPRIESSRGAAGRTGVSGWTPAGLQETFPGYVQHLPSTPAPGPHGAPRLNSRALGRLRQPMRGN